MQTKNDLLNYLISSDKFINNYNKAIELLREVNFEFMLTLLGHPESKDYKEDNALQSMAFDQAELVGWHKCINEMFHFLDIHKNDLPSKEDLDFGARAKLNNLGYSSSDIEKLLNNEDR